MPETVSLTDASQAVPSPPPRRRLATAVVVLLALIVVTFAVLAIVLPPDGKTRGDGWRFAGRMHPVLVHLPIGLIVLVPVLELCGLPRRFRHLQATAGFVLWLAALNAVLAVALGYLLARNDGISLESETVTYHLIAGLATAALSIATLALRLRSVPPTPRVVDVLVPAAPMASTAVVVPPIARRRPLATVGYAISLTLLLAAVTLAGHLGGQLTYGEAYFSEVAPRSVAWLLGPIGGGNPKAPAAKPSPLPTTASSPPESSRPGLTPDANFDPSATTAPTSNEAAPTTTVSINAPASVTFAADVMPVFAQSCVSCHGPAKVKGGLRLDTYALLRKGGDGGDAVVPGSADQSDLYHRMTLPPDLDEAMPPPGARVPRPTAEQLAAVKSWIDGGAKDD